MSDLVVDLCDPDDIYFPSGYVSVSLPDHGDGFVYIDVEAMPGLTPDEWRTQAKRLGHLFAASEEMLKALKDFRDFVKSLDDIEDPDLVIKTRGLPMQIAIGDRFAAIDEAIAKAEPGE